MSGHDTNTMFFEKVANEMKTVQCHGFLPRVLLLLIASSGCSRTGSEMPQFELITDETEVGKITAAIRAVREQELSDAIKNPGALRYDAAQLRMFDRFDSRRLREGLSGRMKSAGNAELRVGAASALIRLGDDEAVTWLEHSLRSGDSQLRAAILMVRPMVYELDDPKQALSRLDVAAAESLMHTDRIVTDAAIQWCAVADVKFPEGAANALYRSDLRPFLRLAIVERLSAKEKTYDRLQTAIAGLAGRNSFQREQAATEAAWFLNSDDARVRNAAETALQGYLNTANEGVRASYLSSSTLQFIESVAATTAPETARRLLAPALKPDSPFREFATDALAGNRRPGMESTQSRWEDWDPALKKAVELGLVDDDDAARLRNELTGDEVPEDDTTALQSVLVSAKRMHWFDAETGVVPVRHDLLLAELCEITGGALQFDGILETYHESQTQSDSGRYTLQVVQVNRAYRFSLADLGDWYDVGGLLTAANRIVEDAGTANRFLMVDTGDQTALILFGNPSKLRSEPTLGKITEPSNQSVKSGREFERRVLEEYGDAIVD